MQQTCGRRQLTHEAEHGEPSRDGYGFCDRHPVDAVHEIDDIDEPDAANKDDRSVQPPRKYRYDTHLVREGCDDGHDRYRLQDQTRDRFKRAHVIGCTDKRKANRRYKDDRESQLFVD